MAKFSGALKQLAKTDNAKGATAAKIAIRRNVLQAVASDVADKAIVFDAFAGEGHMHDAVWCQADEYVGCDERFFPGDSRTAFVADNRRVLRAIDISRFSIFDLDAYGSPWEQLFIIASRRKLRTGEKLGIIITEGQALKMKMGGMSRALSLLSGVRATQSGLGRMQDEVVDRALLRVAAAMHGEIAQRWQAIGKVGSRMMYIGVVLRGRA